MVAFQWHPEALVGLLVLPFCWGIGAFVYFARPEGLQNRRLGLQLLFEGFVVAVLGGAVWLIDDPVLVWGLAGAAMFLVWPKLWTYYSFLATLPTPLARALRRRGVLPALLASTLLAGVSWFVWPEWYLSGVAPAPFAAWAVLPGTGFNFIMTMWGLMWAVGLVFSVSAYLHAATPTQRRQARAYIVAFGTRDVLFLLWGFAWVLWQTEPWALRLFLAFPAIWLVYPVLVGYGILRHQLFDIDVKLRFAVRQSTLAAAFAALFFVVSEGLEAVLAIDGTVPGIVAAGGIVLLLRPVQRAAERVARVIVPAPPDADARRVEVYRAAVEAAWEDGALSSAETGVLRRLRTELGIAESLAGEVEREVRAVLAPRPRGVA